jgi:3-isopropylmalate dehydrogenase
MMLLHSLNDPKAAASIEAAVKQVLASGLRTQDIATGAPGEQIVGCRAMGEAVLKALN